MGGVLPAESQTQHRRFHTETAGTHENLERSMELDCGHQVTPDAGCGTGYAVTSGGKKICYACADSIMAAKLTTDAAVGAYIAGSEQTVTTWSGGVLMRITEHGSHRNGWHGSQVHYWRAVDADGRRWYGRNGGAGMCITMRKAKAS